MLRAPGQIPRDAGAGVHRVLHQEGPDRARPDGGHRLDAGGRPARRAQRLGIELNPQYADIAQQIVADEQSPALRHGQPRSTVRGDQRRRRRSRRLRSCRPIDYVLTSPPYWDMLRARGAETQKKRRATPGLDVFYSDDPHDLGNMDDYDEFVEQLVADLRRRCKPLLQAKGLSDHHRQEREEGRQDLPAGLGSGAASWARRTRSRTRSIWVQDNQRLAPYGLGNAWVSNTFHHYCLQFRNEP